MASTKRSKPRKTAAVNYSTKLKYIRKFQSVSKKAAGNKSFLTRKYKELHSYRNLKFVAVESKKLKKVGTRVPHTNKGIFVPKEKGLKIRVDRKGRIVSRGGVRTEYYFPLSELEVAAFLGDPPAFTETLIEREGLRRKHPREKYYIRLVFRRGQSFTDKRPDDITYIIEMKDTISPRTGKVRKSAAEKTKEFAESIVGIKIIFAGQKKREDDEDDEDDEE